MKPLHLYLGKPVRNAIFRASQRLLLKVPLLSEVRLGHDRVMAFLRAWHYLYRAKVRGDYLEFGVAEGLSFELSLLACAKFFPKCTAETPRFFAFDSFQGLPAPNADHDGTIWGEGEINVPRSVFEANIRDAARGFEVSVWPGFYEQSLRPGVLDEFGVRKAAFVTIDCDLYDSTLAALRFLTPVLQTGTVIYFDDWYFSHGDLSLGEAGACAQWLRENPQITLADYGNVGIMGKLVIVQLREGG